MSLNFKYNLQFFAHEQANVSQGPTPKNDFCRIFSRSKILSPLALVLDRVLDEDDELSELVEGRIVNIFLLFSQAENYVKEVVADRVVLKRTFILVAFIVSQLKLSRRAQGSSQNDSRSPDYNA